MSIRDEIAGADDLKRQEVSVPEWTDEPLFVRELRAEEAEQIAQMADEEDADALRQLQYRLIVLTLVDESGSRVFADDDVPTVASKSWSVVRRLASVAMEVSGLGDDLEDEAGN